MAMFAVLRAAFAAGLLRVVLGRALGERRGLALGRALGGVQALLQIAEGLVQLVDEAVAFRELLAEVLDFGLECLHRKTVHADLDNDEPRQL